MTKRQEIESVIGMFNRHISHQECLDCPAIFKLLREYQSTLPPDREDWEVAYEQYDADPNTGRINKEDFKSLWHFFIRVGYKQKDTNEAK